MMSSNGCPENGAPLQRGTRPLTLTYKDQSVTIDMPGWYRAGSDEGVYIGDDMKVSDSALNRLKARAERLPEPEEIPRIRK
jgi:HTH-type transcriptional regulator/antitoxin MqsA